MLLIQLRRSASCTGSGRTLLAKVDGSLTKRIRCSPRGAYFAGLIAAILPIIPAVPALIIAIWNSSVPTAIAMTVKMQWGTKDALKGIIFL